MRERDIMQLLEKVLKAILDSTEEVLSDDARFAASELLQN